MIILLQIFFLHVFFLQDFIKVVRVLLVAVSINGLSKYEVNTEDVDHDVFYHLSYQIYPSP